MRRLGDAEPDSGHPTPREDEFPYTDDEERSPERSCLPPLTSTPKSDQRSSPLSLRKFFENSDGFHGGIGPDTSILVENLKQLIKTTDENRRLTKEKSEILSRTERWEQEKSCLEKQVIEAKEQIERLQKELENKCIRLEQLELQVADLLKSVVEHPSEEGFEVSEELVTELKNTSIQCDVIEEENRACERQLQELRLLEDSNRLLGVENKELLSKIESLQSAASRCMVLEKELQAVENRNTILDDESKELQKKMLVLQDSAEKSLTLEKISFKELQVLKNQNHSLQAENKKLQNELENLRNVESKSVALEKELQLLEDRDHILSAENKELQSKLESLEGVVNKTVALKKQLDQCKEKCVFLETENDAIREGEKELLRKATLKDIELAGTKERCELLNEELDLLRAECSKSSSLWSQIDELERLLSQKNKELEEEKAKSFSVKSTVEKYERQVEELKAIDAELKRELKAKEVEMKKLSQDCESFQQMSNKLTGDNVSLVSNCEELKKRLSRVCSEMDELRESLTKEKRAREAAEGNAQSCALLEVKLYERAVQIDDLKAANMKMSQEMDFLRKMSTKSVSMEELEQYKKALEECHKELEQAASEKNTLLEKEAAYADKIAKMESFKYELECRDENIAKLRSVESQLRDNLEAKSGEVAEVQRQLDMLRNENVELRQEFHGFQEAAERQYCEMLNEKSKQIDALSSRLIQLETYPGQFVSMDGNILAVGAEENAAHVRNNGVHAVYDYVPPAIRDLAEEAARQSELIAEALKEMRATLIYQTTSGDHEDHPSASGSIAVGTQTCARDEENSFLNVLVESIESCSNYRCQSDLSSLHLQDSLKRLFSSIKEKPSKTLVDFAVRSFLEELSKDFTDATRLMEEELKALRGEKETLEKKLSSENKRWELEQEEMKLSMDRFRRQAEQATHVQKEKLAIMSELSAAKNQIEQLRMKLRYQFEELDRVKMEKEEMGRAANECLQLERNSQEELKKANSEIDELQRRLECARSDLERERRENIRLNDDYDASYVEKQELKSHIADLERRSADLERRCEKLTKTEKYNQKTIQIVCESFWEREEFVRRLRKRSYERKRLIEHFVTEIDKIISSFKGDRDPVNTMQATIKSWTVADDKDDIDHESREKALYAEVRKLGSYDQLDDAHTRMLTRSRRRP